MNIVILFNCNCHTAHSLVSAQSQVSLSSVSAQSQLSLSLSSVSAQSQLSLSLVSAQSQLSVIKNRQFCLKIFCISLYYALSLPKDTCIFSCHQTVLIINNRYCGFGNCNDFLRFVPFTLKLYLQLLTFPRFGE